MDRDATVGQLLTHCVEHAEEVGTPRSSMLTKTTRESSYWSARFQTRLVLTSTP
jgi:hypothetical protein